MVQQLVLQGMILSTMPIGEYDKRVVILTTKRGKITAFSRGSRRSNSAMLGATSPFVFGEFTLIEGRTSYTLVGANISNYFMELRNDITAAYYGFYFLEFAGYYARENVNETHLLKLLYQTMRILCKKVISEKLIRRIFELKILVINGEYPQCFQCVKCGSTKNLFHFSCINSGIICNACKGGIYDLTPISESALYTIQYIISADIEKLYTFNVTEEVLGVLEKIMDLYLGMYIDKSFKSLEILQLMTDDLSLS